MHTAARQVCSKLLRTVRLLQNQSAYLTTNSMHMPQCTVLLTPSIPPCLLNPLEALSGVPTLCTRTLPPHCNCTYCNAPGHYHRTATAVTANCNAPTRPDLSVQNGGPNTNHTTQKGGTDNKAAPVHDTDDCHLRWLQPFTDTIVPQNTPRNMPPFLTWHVTNTSARAVPRCWTVQLLSFALFGITGLSNLHVPALHFQLPHREHNALFQLANTCTNGLHIAHTKTTPVLPRQQPQLPTSTTNFLHCSARPAWKQHTSQVDPWLHVGSDTHMWCLRHLQNWSQPLVWHAHMLPLHRHKYHRVTGMQPLGDWPAYQPHNH